MTTIADIEIKLRDAKERKSEIGKMIMGCIDDQLAKVGVEQTIDILSGRIGAYKNACHDVDEIEKQLRRSHDTTRGKP